MKLRIHVANEKWQEFDSAWAESAKNLEPIEDLLGALMLIGKKKRMPRCLPQLKDHAAKLAEAERFEDAARILGAALLAGASSGEIGSTLAEHCEKAWGDESWFASYADLAGLRADSEDLRKGWKIFDKMRSYAKDQVVFHPGGWGTGQITEVLPDEQSVTIRFTTGKVDTFPMSAAVDIFQVLPHDDLRAMHLVDPDGVKDRMKEEPLAILRAIVERAGGKATMVTIRNAMMQIGVEGTSWTSWWRKAKKVAEGSEWFRVTGAGTKTEVTQLAAATDPVDDLRRQLNGIGTLSDLLTRVRELMTGEKLEENLRELAREILAREADNESQELGERMAVWLFLYEHTKETHPELMAQFQKAALESPSDDPSVAPPLWALFQSVPTAREQDRCLDLLPEIFSDDTWLDHLALNLQHAPPGMVRGALERLSTGGRKDVLAEHYNTLLTRPLRSPHVFVSLARLAETGKLEGKFPPKLKRAQALLSLSTYLYLNRRTDVLIGRVNTRLVEFLTKGREPVLRQLLEDADYEGLLSCQTTIQRGVEEIIDNLVTAMVVRAAPEPAEGSMDMFWESDSVWSTRPGLKKRQAELKELLDEKIPAAEEAIGRAASYGDLSENAEWTAAVEERRNLSEMVGQLKQDLRKVDLIEDAIRPDGVVCPGSFVRVINLTTNEENSFTILGPWDTDAGDDVISYRAPLAAALLGHRLGEEATAVLPTGEAKLKVLEVREAQLA